MVYRLFIKVFIALLIVMWSGTGIYSQKIPWHPYSNLADEGCLPCKDTVKVLFLKKVFDLGLLLPEWKPVVDPEFVGVIEGTVVPAGKQYVSCHVSSVDFSGYHYTHDFSMDVLPDRTPDDRYGKYLAQRIYTNEEGKTDTVSQQAIHVEWESGVGAGNKGNPATQYNIAGNSAGFFSAGHQRGDVFWNWPTIGDWVHVEGQWIWDRGHPPARTELHPLRFVAVRRQLPDYIPSEENSADSVYATRVDIFASGDGGALFNNRKGVPDFVQPVKMSSKDYEFEVRSIIPRPENARLYFRITDRAGNSYTDGIQVVQKKVGDEIVLNVKISWKDKADTLIFAKTLYFWWEAPQGIPENYTIATYDVTLNAVKIHLRKDLLSRSEWRIFADAGGNWIFLNDFVKGKDVTRSGTARTYRRKWKLEKTFRLYVPAGTAWRLHASGWEEDGIGRSNGHLLNPDAECGKATFKKFHQHLWPATPFGLRGCLDDPIGEVNEFHLHDDRNLEMEYKAISHGKRNEFEQCPCVRGIQENVFEMRYEVKRVK